MVRPPASALRGEGRLDAERVAADSHMSTEPDRELDEVCDRARRAESAVELVVAQKGGVDPPGVAASKVRVAGSMRA